MYSYWRFTGVFGRSAPGHFGFEELATFQHKKAVGTCHLRLYAQVRNTLISNGNILNQSLAAFPCVAAYRSRTANSIVLIPRAPRLPILGTGAMQMAWRARVPHGVRTTSSLTHPTIASRLQLDTHQKWLEAALILTPDTRPRTSPLPTPAHGTHPSPEQPDCASDIPHRLTPLDATDIAPADGTLAHGATRTRAAAGLVKALSRTR